MGTPHLFMVDGPVFLPRDPRQLVVLHGAAVLHERLDGSFA
ncbi:hypothetical protein [Sinorhizobium medicae]|nr:hypothetical protein [Sinorhizobium medicae]